MHVDPTWPIGPTGHSPASWPNQEPPYQHLLSPTAPKRIIRCSTIVHESCLGHSSNTVDPVCSYIRP
ncbi:unnamed protein product [Calypogeia fissa]